MDKLKVLIYVAILAVLVNYLNDPIAGELPGWWASKVWLGLWRLAFKLTSWGSYFGMDDTVLIQNNCLLPAKLVPKFPAANVTTTEASFAGTPVLIYRPPVEELTGRGLLYFHGGGWVVGHADYYVDQLTWVAKELGAVVVYVDYRRAPKHPFPAAAEDCISAYKHFVDNAKAFNVDPTRIAVMGDSAGGNLAAVTSLDTLTSGYTPPPKLQVLIFPVLQGSNLHTPSYLANSDGPLLTSHAMAFFFAAYLFGDDYKQYIDIILANNHTSADEKKRNAREQLTLGALPKDKFTETYKENLENGDHELWQNIQDKFRDPMFAPLFAQNLSGVAPAYINTCQYDVLRDDGFYYAKRLREAKVKVQHDNIICLHTWTYITSYVEKYAEEYRKMMKYMKENI